MEVCGHQIFPELLEKAEPRTQSRDPLRDMDRELRRLKREEKAARIAAERERQQKEDDFYLSDTEDYFPDDIRDARVSGHTTCKLLELPPDILNLIVDHSLPQNPSPVGNGSTYIAALKHLRLIHPCFAYLRLLLNRLFGSLALRADPDQLRQLDKGIERIAPFVKRVTFCTVKVRRADLARRRQRDSSHEIRRVLGRRVNKVVDSGELLAGWSRLLKQCPNLVSFHVSRGLVDLGTIDLGPSAQTLIDLVVKSIVAAKKPPQDISIEYTTDNERIWTALPEWTHVDFADLKELDLSLAFETGARKLDPVPAFRGEISQLISHMLRTSNGSLRILAASGHALDALLQFEIPVLPALYELRLNGYHGHHGAVDPLRLGRLISRLSGLKRLCLEHISTFEYQDSIYWQHIFRAIRDHQNDLFIEFIELRTASAMSYDWTLNASFQLPQPHSKVEDSDSVDQALTKSVKNYLSKHQDEWYLQGRTSHQDQDSDSEPLGKDWQSDEE